MINRRLIVTDHSNDVSCHNKNLVLCSMRFSCPAQVGWLVVLGLTAL